MTLSTRELGLLNNTDVLGYIQAQNAARNAQAQSEGWQFWTLMSEEISSDYSNAYELELCFARSTYSDIHKDWSGRRGYVSDELTLEQVEAEISRIAKWVAEECQAELEREADWARKEREDIALGLVKPTADVELEQWEVYEAMAEAEGY